MQSAAARTSFAIKPQPLEVAFAPIRSIGGRTGWYFANTLWQWRGWIDRLFGGVGMSRGRRDGEDCQVGARSTAR